MQKKGKGFSFTDDRLAFQGSFHQGTSLEESIRRVEQPRDRKFMRFDRSVQRKMGRARKRLQNKNEEVAINLDQHEYDYKQFGEEPPVDFSPVSLLFLAPVLLCVNVSMVHREEIPTTQFLFVSFLVSFVFNHVFILRRNRLMPFLPVREQDNKLKIASAICVVAMYFCLSYGWSASGGMIFAIIWESFNGRQGCFYLIIFGAVVGGSITMELSNPEDFFIKLIPSILFGIAQSLLQTLKDNSPYAIANQMSLFLMVGSVAFYIIMDVKPISAYQCLILLILGFAVYLNLLLIIRLMQTVRVSMVMGVMSGIIIISSTTFNSMNDYVACLTIILSILVLLKLEYLDKK